MRVNIIIFIGICISYVAVFVEADRIVYQKSIDVYDRRNWENQSPQKDCQGFVLNDFDGYTMFRKLEVQRLIFGSSGHVRLTDDTVIVFNEHSNSVMNCVVTNGTAMSMSLWSDPSNWLRPGKELNEAVPHLERMPCEHDDVEFPKGVLSGVVIIPFKTKIKSLKFGENYWNNEDNVFLKKSEISFASDHLIITDDACVDPSGCACGNVIENEEICNDIPEPESFECSEPILPKGFCYRICGASITFESYVGLKIAEIDKKLKKYTSDTHVSKVKSENGNDIIQIVLTEKTFSGDCIEEAKELYQGLTTEKIIVSENAYLTASGHNIKAEGRIAKDAVSMVFGTLLGTCLLFGILIFVLGDERTKNLRERLGLGSRPLTYRSIFFSRNGSVSEDAGLVVEGLSVAGSLHNIPRSFENPAAFSKRRRNSSSTSSSSAHSTADTVKENKQQEDITFESQEARELIEDVAENGELVDLSEMN